MTPSDHLHVNTPLRESVPLSKLAGTKVYLKLECAQPTASFKIRGIGNFCKMWVERGCKHFITSSGKWMPVAAFQEIGVLGQHICEKWGGGNQR
ncbi:hypothetical protein Chor_013055 [Crotalus horridus]